MKWILKLKFEVPQIIKNYRLNLKMKLCFYFNLCNTYLMWPHVQMMKDFSTHFQVMYLRKCGLFLYFLKTFTVVHFLLILYLKQFHAPNLTVYLQQAEWLMLALQRIKAVIYSFFKVLLNWNTPRHWKTSSRYDGCKKYIHMDFIYSVRYLRRAFDNESDMVCILQHE